MSTPTAVPRTCANSTPTTSAATCATIPKPTAQGQEVKVPIDVAWIADNDGWDPEAPGGPFVAPNIAGTRVIRAPNPRLETSFNWWVSFTAKPSTYGPSWEAYCAARQPRHGLDRDVRHAHGRRAQVSGAVQPRVRLLADLRQPPRFHHRRRCSRTAPWNRGAPATPPPSRITSPTATTRATCFPGDPSASTTTPTPSGRRIYRLNPGEKFNMTIAYVAGENFHDPGNAQTIELADHRTRKVQLCRPARERPLGQGCLRQPHVRHPAVRLGQRP